MIDGKLLTEDVATAFDEGQIAKVPLLIGSNSYEAGFFANAAKGLAQRLATVWPRITAVYDGYGTKRTDLVELQLTTDMMITAPTRTAARAAAAHGAPTFLYYYSYVRPSQRVRVPGASHMDEVYALFGHMNLMPGDAAGSARCPARGGSAAGALGALCQHRQSGQQNRTVAGTGTGAPAAAGVQQRRGVRAHRLRE